MAAKKKQKKSAAKAKPKRASKPAARKPAPKKKAAAKPTKPARRAAAPSSDVVYTDLRRSLSSKLLGRLLGS